MYLSKNYRLTIFSIFLILFVTYGISAKTRINLDHDGKADFLTRQDQNWYGRSSETGETFTIQWGYSTDKAVPADYDGDGITDIAVFRPENSIWYIRKSSDGEMLAFQWGLSDDILVPADYDGDGKTDIAVYRRSNEYWYVLTSGNNYNYLFYKMNSRVADKPLTEFPVPADYDGDGKDDFALAYSFAYFVNESSIGKIKEFADLDCPNRGMYIPNDFDGDNTDDFGCVYTHVSPQVNYYWTYFGSESGQRSDNFYWGVSPSHIVAPDDYDGDGITDYAIKDGFGYYWIYYNGTQTYEVIYFGAGVPAQYYLSRDYI